MRWLVLVGAVAVLAGCGGSSGPKGEGIVAGLESHGVTPTSPQYEPPGVLQVESKAYTVPGGVLHVFKFADAVAAKEAAARVQPGGYMVRSTSGINQAVDWAAPPHWYRDGKEIAVYIGTESEVIDALGEVAGQQFAGG